MLLPNFTFLTRNVNKTKENNYWSIVCDHLTFWQDLHCFLENGWYARVAAFRRGDRGFVKVLCRQPMCPWLRLTAQGPPREFPSFRAPDEGRARHDKNVWGNVTFLRVKMTGFLLGFKAGSLHVQVVSSPWLSFCNFTMEITMPSQEWGGPEWGHSGQGPKPGPDPLQCRP